MRRRIFLVAIASTTILLMLLPQAFADTAKYLIPLYKISQLGPPIQYDPNMVGNVDIAVTEKAFTAQVNLHLSGGLPNMKYQAGLGLRIGSTWSVNKSSLKTDGNGAGNATLTMNIPKNASKPYSIVVVLVAKGSYIASKRIVLMHSP